MAFYKFSVTVIMKKEDVYKKVDAMLKRFKKEAGESANRFPMKSEVSFKEWKGKRLYIKVDLTDACDEHHRYECGYIDLSTGKYSSKGATLSLVRPNYELLKFDFSMLPRVCQEFCVNRFNKQHRIAA